MTSDSDNCIKLDEVLSMIDEIISSKQKIRDAANDKMVQNEHLDDKLYDAWAKATGAIMALSDLRKIITEKGENQC